MRKRTAWTYLALALPNILVSSAIFFALATATRSMMTTYVGVVAFLIVWLVVNGSLLQNPEYRELAALTDPFGVSAYADVARYWTAAERNALVPDFETTVTNPPVASPYSALNWVVFTLNSRIESCGKFCRGSPCCDHVLVTPSATNPLL